MSVKRLIEDIEAIGKENEVFHSLLSVCKTKGGRLTEHGENLCRGLRASGYSKTEISKILNVTPSALTRFD
jgi:hypothetical protein